MNGETNTAIVLAAGQGKRMGTKIQKQYLEIEGKPILYYSLDTFEKSPIINEIILVVGEGQEEFCRKQIVERYGFTKVTAIVEGGAERYHSVYNGLAMISGEGYVFIHDGARPFVTEEILQRAYKTVVSCKACVVGMPVKDTIKQADSEDFVETTPDRNKLWMIQTPQVFEKHLIKDAYEKLLSLENVFVTDDGMVVEQMTGVAVKLVEGSYRNMKITTPEDLIIGAAFVAQS